MTNSVYFLKNCDDIILFDNGYLKSVENYYDLKESSKLFNSIIQSEIKQESDTNSNFLSINLIIF